MKPSNFSLSQFATPTQRVALAIFLCGYHKAYCDNLGIAETAGSRVAVWSSVTMESMVAMALKQTQIALRRGQPPTLVGPPRGHRLGDELQATAVPVGMSVITSVISKPKDQ